MKLCTSIEQSKRLIKLGIDVNTADIIYNMFDESYIRHDTPIDKYHKPAWSLTALLELMPPYLFEFERGIDLNIYPNLNGKGWHCSYMPNNIESVKKDKFKQITNGDNAVDAAFEMVCWLKENGKL